ncbi:hypothetical protein TruAng_004258 [Truncatella angustata]|nr:hypothetical protein TruAng_004258 [Truncatella angustata]
MSYIRVLHDRIHYLEQKLEQHGISIEPFGGESAPTSDLRDSEPARLLSHYESVSHADVTNLVGSNPSTATRHRGSIPAASPVSLDTDDMESGITAMGTIADEDEIDGAFDTSGEFYGTSSAASFMQEAMATARSPKHTVIPLINPPQSDGGRRTIGARTCYLNFSHSESFSLPPRSLADHLLDRFWTKVFYLYPIFHRPAFEQAYQNIWKTEGEVNLTSEFSGVGLGSSPDGEANTILFHCALNTIFAIGATFSDLSPAPKDTAAKSFLHKAKSFIGLDLLETNNIGVVQCLLLLAVFLQSTPFPTRTWNAVGVACRVAQGLGLHTEAPKGDRSQLEIEISRRTWHGCVILDMIVSMTFGRPTMTANIPPRPMPSVVEYVVSGCGRSSDLNSQHCPSQLQFFNEYSRLCELLKDILSQVYEGGNNGLATGAMQAQTKSHDFKLTLELDSRLASFEQSVPPILSWMKPQNLTEVPESQRLIFETQRIVLHGRFLYLRIMLHRPILTQLCVAGQAAPKSRTKHTGAVRDDFSTGGGARATQETPQPAIGDLVEILPFELMDDSTMNELSFDWSQPLNLFTEDIATEIFQ